MVLVVLVVQQELQVKVVKELDIQYKTMQIHLEVEVEVEVVAQKLVKTIHPVLVVLVEMVVLMEELVVSVLHHNPVLID
jgi:hypothetical protein